MDLLVRSTGATGAPAPAGRASSMQASESSKLLEATQTSKQLQITYDATMKRLRKLRRELAVEKANDVREARQQKRLALRAVKRAALIADRTKAVIAARTRSLALQAQASSSFHTLEASKGPTEEVLLEAPEEQGDSILEGAMKDTRIAQQRLASLPSLAGLQSQLAGLQPSQHEEPEEVVLVQDPEQDLWTGPPAWRMPPAVPSMPPLDQSAMPPRIDPTRKATIKQALRRAQSFLRPPGDGRARRAAPASSRTPASQAAIRQVLQEAKDELEAVHGPAIKVVVTASRGNKIDVDAVAKRSAGVATQDAGTVGEMEKLLPMPSQIHKIPGVIVEQHQDGHVDMQPVAP